MFTKPGSRRSDTAAQVLFPRRLGTPQKIEESTGRLAVNGPLNRDLLPRAEQRDGPDHLVRPRRDEGTADAASSVEAFVASSDSVSRKLFKSGFQGKG